jgi:hypothetical protein
MLSEAVNGSADVQSQDCECELEIQLRSRILGALETAGYPELRSVRCQVDEGVVVLRGVLPSYHLKQVAQHAILALNTWHVVKNLIDVSSRATNVSRRGTVERFNCKLR